MSIGVVMEGVWLEQKQGGDKVICKLSKNNDERCSLVAINGGGYKSTDQTFLLP